VETQEGKKEVGQYCTHIEWKNTYERSSLSLEEESGTGLGGFTLRLKIKVKAISINGVANFI
jgi:hypothetical protein